MARIVDIMGGVDVDGVFLSTVSVVAWYFYSPGIHRNNRDIPGFVSITLPIGDATRVALLPHNS